MPEGRRGARRARRARIYRRAASAGPGLCTASRNCRRRARRLASLAAQSGAVSLTDRVNADRQNARGSPLANDARRRI